MEIQDDHKIDNGTIISNDLENAPDQLDLLNNLKELQIKREEEIDQKEGNELKSGVELQELANIQDDNTDTTDGSDSSSDSISTCDDDILASDNEIVADLLTKIKAFIEETNQENIEKDILIHEWQIFNDFFNLIDKHEKNLIDEDLSVIRKALQLSIQTIFNGNRYDLFKTDLVYGKKIFYMYFSLFNIDLIHNYLKNPQMSADLNISYEGYIAVMFFVMRSAAYHAELGLHDVQRPVNWIELLSLLLNYLKTHLKSSELISGQSSGNLLDIREQCLGILMSYSNKTVLVSDLIKIGCPETMINALTMMCNRHDEGVKQLNALNTAEVIKLFQTKPENILLNTMCCAILALLSTPEQIKNDYERMKDVLDTLLKLVYEAVVSSDYKTKGWHVSELLVIFVKLFTDDRVLSYIMEHSQVDLHTSLTIEFFINLLITYHSTVPNENLMKPITCTALVNILWSISFQDTYKQQLKNNDKKFKKLIQNFANGEAVEKLLPNQYVPQYIESVQKAAKGILFNIDEPIDSEIKQVNSVTKVSNNNEKPMIMVSYSHEDIDFCKQLHDEIHKRGYDIWIDFKFLKTGDLWEQIAAGMKRADLIICLMSEDYCKSKSCRWEAIYALDKLQTKKSIIPVLLRKHELPGWLDIRIAMLKYVRFLDLKQLENDKLLELMTAIEDSLPANVPRTDHSLHSPILPTHHEPKPIPVTKTNEFPSHNSNILPKHHDESAQTKQDISLKAGHTLSTTTDQSPYPEKPVEQWNKNDISRWFEHNEILTELRDLCRFKDGCGLLEYRKIFLETKKLQYQTYSDEFLRSDGITLGQRPLLLHEFTKFANALQKLDTFKKSA